MVAEFKDLYDTIVNSETFHSWFAKNPKVQLSHFFAQINQNYIPTSAWDLGFFNPEDEKITVFTLNEANEIIQKNTDDVFKQKQAKVHTLDPKELDNFLDFKDSIVYCQKAIEDSFPGIDSLRGSGFAILQTLQDDTKEEESLLPTWNISFITKKLSFLNIKLEASSGKLISTKEHSMMSPKK